eukprot:771336-Rhodomonas_salina.2
MNRAFRPRPIDFSRAMPVVRSQNELELNDEGVLVPKKDLLINPLEDDLGNDDEVGAVGGGPVGAAVGSSIAEEGAGVQELALSGLWVGTGYGDDPDFERTV